MSADGFGVFGAAVLALAAAPILIGGAAITGTVYGSVKLTKHIAQQRRKSNTLREQREAEQRARLAEQEAEERERIQEIMQSYSSLQSNQRAAMNRINEQMLRSYTSFANEMQKEQNKADQDISRLANNAAIRKKELFTSWKKEIDVQAKSYADSLHTTFGTMKAEVNHQISKFNEMKTQLQENMRLQEYASSQLKDAEAAIHAVQIELGSIPNNTVEEYNKAADYFNKGMYEPAYGIASSIVLECYDYLEEGISDREKKYALIDLLEAQIVEMKAQIESMKAFQFEYKDEMYETDLSMYEPVFKAVISRLEKLDAAISDIDGKTLRDFADIQEQLADIELDIQNCTNPKSRRDTWFALRLCRPARPARIIFPIKPMDYPFSTTLRANLNLNGIYPASFTKASPILRLSTSFSSIHFRSYGGEYAIEPPAIVYLSETRASPVCFCIWTILFPVHLKAIIDWNALNMTDASASV